MNNVKLRGRQATIAGLKVRGLKWARKPKHTPRELADIKTLTPSQKHLRSRNRAASRKARQDRRVTRHGR